MRTKAITNRLTVFLLGSAATLLTVQAIHAQDGGVTELETLTVEAESDDTLVQDGYVAKQDRLGTKVDTPIAKIPQAISVVTQDQIEDQKPRTLNEALGYTASANPNSFGFDSRYDAFFLRGFPAHYNGMFRDGLRQYNGPSAWFKTEPYGIEGVTILKGPGVLALRHQRPGRHRQRGDQTPQGRAVPRGGIAVWASTTAISAAVDVVGAGERGAAACSTASPGSARLSDTELPAYPDDKVYLAPALTFKPDEDTKLTILGEYSKLRHRRHRGFLQFLLRRRFRTSMRAIPPGMISPRTRGASATSSSIDSTTC